jgi:ABC-type transport system substrate-binding protein
MDKDELEAKAFKGSHMAATGGFVHPGMAGHSPVIGLVYDPDLTRRLLSEAGYPNGKVSLRAPCCIPQHLKMNA